MYKNDETHMTEQKNAPQEKTVGVDLKKCTEEEFWQEVKYSGSDSHSER